MNTGFVKITSDAGVDILGTHLKIFIVSIDLAGQF